jgi:hypothetical protein
MSASCSATLKMSLRVATFPKTDDDRLFLTNATSSLRSIEFVSSDIIEAIFPLECTHRSPPSIIGHGIAAPVRASMLKVKRRKKEQKKKK